jgi:hypothetical protein
MTSDDFLKRGIAALKAGQKEQARNLLLEVVEHDESNEMAWLWLSGAADSDEERYDCLANVLAINPGNGIAQRGIEALLRKSPDLAGAPPRPPTETGLQAEPTAVLPGTLGLQPADRNDFDPLLRQADAALKAGDTDTAERLLIELLEQDEDNEAAWILMIDCAIDRSAALGDAQGQPEPKRAAAAAGPQLSLREQARKNRRTCLTVGAVVGILALVSALAGGLLLVSWNALSDSPQDAFSAVYTKVPTPAPPTHTPLSTATPAPTWTKAPTRTALATSTRVATQTPFSTKTPFPTLSPAPKPTAAVQTLGPVTDPVSDQTYTIEFSLDRLRFRSGSEFPKPKAGYVFVIAYVTINNQGPGVLRTGGSFDFQVRDENGGLRNSKLIPDTSDCRLNPVELAPGGSTSGCVAFEVPNSGSLDLIYTLDRLGGLEPGRYLSFPIR